MVKFNHFIDNAKFYWSPVRKLKQLQPMLKSEEHSLAQKASVEILPPEHPPGIQTQPNLSQNPPNRQYHSTRMANNPKTQLFGHLQQRSKWLLKENIIQRMSFYDETFTCERCSQQALQWLFTPGGKWWDHTSQSQDLYHDCFKPHEELKTYHLETRWMLQLKNGYQALDGISCRFCKLYHASANVQITEEVGQKYI
ncbi:hypothetical protein NPIL_598091 [Nephila pilipes]|uniref:Uncharacterized protein n=1 Tax=Nephila pilipes TaxID=299642 RepID=A0A8X6PG56_NEPPI|nr:hypothetical protein NPIL_598091 [Nephila pilipes]